MACDSCVYKIEKEREREREREREIERERERESGRERRGCGYRDHMVSPLYTCVHYRTARHVYAYASPHSHASIH